MGLGRYPGMQRETGNLTKRVTKLIFWVARRQGLQGEHLAPCLRPDGNAVGDRMPQELTHRVVVHRIPSQIAVFGIPLQQALALQKAANALGDGVRQPGEFGAGQRLDPTEPGCSIRLTDIHPIKEQPVKVYVEVQRTAEALNQGDRAGLGRLSAMVISSLNSVSGRLALIILKKLRRDYTRFAELGLHCVLCG
ncbi:hypothetical protein MNBD_GAMMA13-911 [hydrothermal vent metagenome]|uniref:Uncharacterized protein n=1 Tax=hydrothermal vent metagenome TaxID=652676 RepID=A0A3B0ZGQ2_9ZZZZ